MTINTVIKNLVAMQKNGLIFFLILCTVTTGFAFYLSFEPMLKKEIAANTPEELGEVNWLRDMNTAIAEARTQQKPILILFQEVPGCATCRNYGNGALSHPLIVEAIESEFIPLAIYNNKGGEDARVLKYFGEPSWNNPVVRIVDTNKKDLIPRLNRNYSAAGLVDAMVRALDVHNRVAPKYLELLHEELQAQNNGLETATFAMYCFWTGEKNLGQMGGVISTKAGFMDGKEVVQVQYDPSQVSYENLVQSAQKVRCNSHTYTENATQKAAAEKLVGKDKVSNVSTFRADREPKYYLGKTHFKYVPMTRLQAARANSLIAQGTSPNEVLSPRQIELAKSIKKQPNKKWKDVIGVDFVKAWKIAMSE